MRKPTTLEMFGLLHPETETQVEPKFPTIGEPSNSKVHQSYVNKVKKTLINLEETYGKGFTILSKQGCNTTSEHRIHQLLE